MSWRLSPQYPMRRELGGPSSGTKRGTRTLDPDPGIPLGALRVRLNARLWRSFSLRLPVAHLNIVCGPCLENAEKVAKRSRHTCTPSQFRQDSMQVIYFRLG